MSTYTNLMETLAKLFGGLYRVKVMRLFLFSPELAFETADIAARAKVSVAQARSELQFLKRVGLIRKKQGSREEKIERRGKVKVVAKKFIGWTLDPTFDHLEPLRSLVLRSNLLQPEHIVEKLSKAGKLKLVIVAGVFIQNLDSRVDLLVVGDKIDREALAATIRTIESEVGKDLDYAVFDTADFQYRLGVYDKLLRDILDYPHKRLVDKLNVR
jgi:hypothetical protein